MASGWTFQPMPEAGLSIVLPPGWSSAVPGDRWAAERDALSAVATRYAPYKPFVDSAIDSIAAGGLDLVAVDTSPSALASGTGAVVDGSGWATTATPNELIDALKRDAPASTDPATYEQDEQDLAAGHGLRLSFRDTSSKPALRIRWVVDTPRGPFLLRFRADADVARGFDELAETVAGSLRPLAGKRDDQVAGLGRLEPVALVLDASDGVSAEWLEAEKQAAIDFLAELSWGEPVTVVASGGSSPRVVVPLTASYSRSPLARAIRSIEQSGEPNAGAAVAAARAQLALEKEQLARRHIVVLAASDGGLDGAAIAESVYTPDSSLEALHGIALGRGPQERQLFTLAGGKFADNGYAVAPTPGEIGHALSLVRRSWDTGSLPIATGRVGPGAAASVLVPAGAEQVRFVVDTPSSVVAPTVVDPAGRRFGLDTPQPMAAIVEGVRGTSIVIPAPAPGTWTLEVAATGSAPVDDAGFVAEAFGTRLFVSWPRAESVAGAGGPLDVALALSDIAIPGDSGVVEELVETLSIEDPAGVSYQVTLDRANVRNLGMSGGTVEGVTVYSTRLPGSYHLLIDVDGRDADGVPFHIEPETWHYVEPSVGG